MTHAARFAAVAALALGLACSTVTERMSPDADLAAPPGEGSYRQGNGSSAEALPEQWWLLFEDPTLNGLIEQLNTGNPDVSAALARVDQSFAVLGITRGPQLPTVRGNGSLGRQRQSVNNLLFPLATPENNRFQLGASATWELDLWGRVRSSVKRDRLRAEAAAVDYRDALLSLQSALARQYFAWRAADAELSLLRQIHRSEEEKLKLEEARLKFGQAVRADVLRAKIALRQTAAAVEAAGRNRGKLLHAIAVLTGVMPSALRLDDSGPELAAAPVIPAGLPSELLVRRPDLISADRKLRAASAQVGARRADFLPKITLVGSGGMASLKAGSLFDAGSGFFDIGPQIDIPIFQGSVSKSAIAQARAQFREAAAVYRSAFLTAVREVDDALLDAKSYAQEMADQQSAVAAAGEAATAAKDRHETGLGSLVEYLSAEQTRLQTVIRENAIASEQRLAAVRLIQALGGSWGD